MAEAGGHTVRSGQGEEEPTGSGQAAAFPLTLPGGEVRRVQRSRTRSGSPLLAPATWLIWFLPLGTRAGGVPGAKVSFPLSLAPTECLSHPSTSHRRMTLQADVALSGPSCYACHTQLSQREFGVKTRYENYTLRDQKGTQAFMLNGVISPSGTLHTAQ